MPLLVLAVGCNGAWKAEGVVESNAGWPIEGASVTVVCADVEQPLDTTVTIATGRFEVAGSGAARALGCSLEVRKPGYHMRTVRMTEACFRSAKTNNYDEPCSARDGHVTLVPE